MYTKTRKCPRSQAPDQQQSRSELCSVRMPQHCSQAGVHGFRPQGERKNGTIHLFSKHSPGAHHRPGAVPDTGAATVAKQTSSLPPWDSHPEEETNLEKIIVEVQSS